MFMDMKTKTELRLWYFSKISTFPSCIVDLGPSSTKDIHIGVKLHSFTEFVLSLFQFLKHKIEIQFPKKCDFTQMTTCWSQPPLITFASSTTTYKIMQHHGNFCQNIMWTNMQKIFTELTIMSCRPAKSWHCFIFCSSPTLLITCRKHTSLNNIHLAASHLDIHGRCTIAANQNRVIRSKSHWGSASEGVRHRHNVTRLHCHQMSKIRHTQMTRAIPGHLCAG